MKINASWAHPHGTKPIKPQTEAQTKDSSHPDVCDFCSGKHFNLRPPRKIRSTSAELEMESGTQMAQKKMS